MAPAAQSPADPKQNKAMAQARKPLVRTLTLALVIIVLAGAFSQRAFQNLSRIDFRNSNFVFFWIAGRMVLAGQNPYDTSQWLAQHELNHATWQPNRIFPYPLPLAILLAPLGMLTLEAAYVGWQLFTLVVVSLATWAILRTSSAPQPLRVFFPLLLCLMFFGPVFLTLQIGALGGLTLGAVVGAILALERRRELLAGALLSIVLLKPPQGLPLLILGGTWLVFHRSWRALLGLSIGAFVLLVAGLLLDPAWPLAFASIGQMVMTRNLGLHSNVFSLASHACSGGASCTWILGGGAALVVGAATLVYLWRRRSILSHMAAFSVIIPIAFVTAVYAWSYDQILYVIPIAWATGQLAVSARGYALTFVFTIVLVVLSILVLIVQARTGTDLLSSITSLLVLVAVGAALARRQSSPA